MNTKLGEIVYNVLKTNSWEKDFGYYIYRKYNIEKPPQRKRKKPTQQEIVDVKKQMQIQSEEFEYNEKYFKNLFHNIKDKYNYTYTENTYDEMLNFNI